MYRLPRRTVLVALMAAFVWTMTLRPAASLLGSAVHPASASASAQSAASTQAATPPGPNVLRLHILANSNRGADQAAKLAVRDALLPLVETALGPARNAKQADIEARRAAPALEQAADRTLSRLGRTYRARIVVGSAYFPVKRWGGLTLHAGVYPAVTVVLGKGTGQNWWCVVFPPLCLANPLNSVTRNEPPSAPEVMLGSNRTPVASSQGLGAWIASVFRSL